MYMPSHTQTQPTLVVFERLSSESHVQTWGSRGGPLVAQCLPCLNPTAPLLQGGV